MRYVFEIALNGLRVYFADRENVVGLLVLPIVFTLVLGLANPGGGSPDSVRVRVDLLDQDNSPQSAQLIQALRQTNPALYFCPADDSTELACQLPSDADGTLSQAQAIERVRTRDTNALIVIPEGYGAQLQALQNTRLSYYSLADMTSGDPVETALNSALTRINASLTAARVAQGVAQSAFEQPLFADTAAEQTFVQGVVVRAENLLAQNPVQLDAQSSTGQVISATTAGFGQSVPGMGSMYVMFTVFTAILILPRERKAWTLQRVASMPITRWQLLGGKILTYVILGMMQYAVVFAVGFVVGMSFGTAPLAILLTMIAFTLCSTALAFALATRIKTEQQANGISLLLALTLAPLGGAWWPLTIVPPFMQVLGAFSPVLWAMRSFQEVIFNQAGLLDVAPYLLVLGVASAVLFAIAVRGFKVEG